jgi:hypothetical protein
MDNKRNMNRYYFVDCNIKENNEKENVYFNLQTALDKSRSTKGSIFHLTTGEHKSTNELYKNSFRFYNNQHIIGTAGTCISSRIFNCNEYVRGLTFEKIKIRCNDFLDFSQHKDLRFINCDFEISIRGNRKCKGCKSAFLFCDTSVSFYNCNFLIKGQYLDELIIFDSQKSRSLILKNCTYKLLYRKIKKIKIYHFHGKKGTCDTLSTFQSYNDSFYAKEIDCKKTKFTILKAKKDYRANILSGSYYFNGKRGSVNIAYGDRPIMMSGLLISATKPSKWCIGGYKNLLLAGFVSNLKDACSVTQCFCAKGKGKGGKCSSSSSSSSCSPCSKSSSCSSNVRKFKEYISDCCGTSYSDGCSSSSKCSKKKSCKTKCSSKTRKCLTNNDSIGSSSSSSSCSSSSSSSCSKKCSKKCSSSSSSSCSSSSSSSCSSSSSSSSSSCSPCKRR